MRAKAERPSATAPLDEQTLVQVRAMRAELGVAAAANRLDITETTLLRSLDGLPVARGTRAQIALRLREVRP